MPIAGCDAFFLQLFPEEVWLAVPILRVPGAVASFSLYGRPVRAEAVTPRKPACCILRVHHRFACPKRIASRHPPHREHVLAGIHSGPSVPRVAEDRCFSIEKEEYPQRYSQRPPLRTAVQKLYGNARTMMGGDERGERVLKSLIVFLEEIILQLIFLYRKLPHKVA